MNTHDDEPPRTPDQWPSPVPPTSAWRSEVCSLLIGLGVGLPACLVIGLSVAWMRFGVRGIEAALTIPWSEAVVGLVVGAVLLASLRLGALPVQCRGWTAYLGY